MVNLHRGVQDVLSSAAHIATREVPLPGEVGSELPWLLCQNEQKICRCLVMRYGTETIPSQMRVCCNRNNLEKRFDKPGRWGFVEWGLLQIVTVCSSKISIVGYQHWGGTC